MSLKTQPEYETQAETETTTKEPAMTTATKEAAASVTNAAIAAAKGAEAAAGTAIEKAKSGAVGAAVKFQVAFADKCGVLDTPTVEGLSLATPRLKAEQGSIFMGEVDLGAEIQFELISFNHRWAIGSGEDDKEAASFFRVSFDGVNVSGHNVTVKDYLDSLKAQGFDKAKSSNYLDLFGFLTWSEKKGPVAVEDRQLCLLQCAPTSVGAFTAFATTRGLLESRGLVKPIDVIEVHAEKRTKGSNKFTNYSFFAPKALK